MLKKKKLVSWGLISTVIAFWITASVANAGYVGLPMKDGEQFEFEFQAGSNLRESEIYGEKGATLSTDDNPAVVEYRFKEKVPTNVSSLKIIIQTKDGAYFSGWEGGWVEILDWTEVTNYGGYEKHYYDKSARWDLPDEDKTTVGIVSTNVWKYIYDANRPEIVDLMSREKGEIIIVVGCQSQDELNIKYVKLMYWCADNDEDGYEAKSCGGNDCNDNDKNIHPNATETCNGKDDNCDDFIDEDLTQATTCGVGACAGNTGTETCTNGVWGNDTCNPLAGATTETCNNIDDNCDGTVDENLAPQQTTCGVGACAGNTGTKTCTNGVWGNDTCDPLAGKTLEVCDGSVDEDCDGTVDEGCECTPGDTRSCGSNVGECSTGIQTCQLDGTWGLECVGEVGSTTEVCDNLDNDCNGKIDENQVCGTDNTSPSVTVNSPNEGENWSGTQSILWTATDAEQTGTNALSTTLYYGTSATGPWTEIVSGQTCTSGVQANYSWNTTLISNGTYWVRIVVSDGAGGSGEDVSNESFISEANTPLWSVAEHWGFLERERCRKTV